MSGRQPTVALRRCPAVIDWSRGDGNGVSRGVRPAAAADGSVPERGGGAAVCHPADSEPLGTGRDDPGGGDASGAVKAVRRVHQHPAGQSPDPGLPELWNAAER